MKQFSKLMLITLTHGILPVPMSLLLSKPADSPAPRRIELPAAA